MRQKYEILPAWIANDDDFVRFIAGVYCESNISYEG